MSEIGDEEAPPPPKRPTIIRPQTGGSLRIQPVRPAPRAPGDKGGVNPPIPASRSFREKNVEHDSESQEEKHRPPVPSSRPNKKNQKDSLSDQEPAEKQTTTSAPPRGPPPKPPHRPTLPDMPTGRPPPKPPHRPVTPQQTTDKPVGPGNNDLDKNTSRSTNGIRPSTKPSRPTSVNIGQTNAVARRPEITVVAARPMSEVGFRNEILSPTTAQTKVENKPSKVPTPSRDPPPKPGLPPVPPRKDILIQSEKVTNSNNAQSIDANSLLDIDNDQSLPPNFPPPLLPSNITDQPCSDQSKSPKLPRPLLPSSKPDNQPTDKVKPPPPKLPKPKLQPEDSQSNTTQSESPKLLKPMLQSDESQSNTTQSESQSAMKNDVIVKPNDVYAVISKPQKPTIIRPTKTKPKPEDKSQCLPPVPSRNYDTDNTKAVPEGCDDTVTDDTRAVTTKSFSVKDSLKMFENEVISEKSSNIDSVKEKPLITSKPVVLPKPRSDSSGSDKTPKPETYNDSEASNDSKSGKLSTNERPKRPTIIRPAPPKQKYTTEVKDEENKDQLSVEEIQSRPLPTPPAKPSSPNPRPPPPKPSHPSKPPSVSLKPNMSDSDLQALEQEDKTEKPHPILRPPPPKPATPPSSKKPSLRSSTSDPDLQDNESKKDRPKPIARSRPMSMQITQDHTKEDSKKPVGRPPPPVKQHLQTDSDSHGHTDAPGRPCVMSRSLTAHRSPVNAPKEESDNEEEEDVKKRPSRPKGGPPRPISTPVKMSSDSERKMEEKSAKPRRPSPRRPSLPQTPPELPSRPGPGHPLYGYMAEIPHGISLHEFNGSHTDELSFQAEEIIVLLKRIDDSWLRGQIGDQEGIFPQDFIQTLVPLPGEEIEKETEDLLAEEMDKQEDVEEQFEQEKVQKIDWVQYGPRCCARFDFEGSGEGDLQFEEGDYIKLLERIDEDWVRGELNGRTGIFPLAFVEVVEDLPADVSVRDETDKTDLKPSPTISDKPIETGPYDGFHQAEFSAMALYDHDGGPGELSLKFGDYINVLGWAGNDWLYGEKDGIKGKFPVSKIDEVPAGLTKEQGPGHSTGVIPVHNRDESVSTNQNVSNNQEFCTALYDYSSDNPEDLNFEEGDVIEILSQVSEDWVKGRLNTREGMFPSNFVQRNLVQNVQPAEKIPVQFGVALYDFDAQNNNELSFKEGEQLVLQEFVSGNEEWRIGEINGKKGIFPANFVQPL